MRITKRQLRRIIREEGYYSKLPKGHIDGQPWPGSLEDLAREQGRTWGHGDVVNPKGYQGHVQRSRRLATGRDGSPLRLTEGQLRKLVREAMLSNMSGLFGSWGRDEVMPDPKKLPGIFDALKMLGYDLRYGIHHDINQIAVDDAMDAYPGEFTYKEIMAAVSQAGGAV